MSRKIELSRRRLLQIGTTAAGGLMIGIPAAFAQRTEPENKSGATQLGFFVKIEPDNHIVIGSPNTEIGQGVMTSYPMVIAEELDADWENCSIEQMGPGLRYDPDTGQVVNWLHVPQGAGGSGSIMSAWSDLRPFVARARAMLVTAAALQWAVPEAECTTAASHVLHEKSGRRLSYGALAGAAATLPEPEDAPLKNRADFKLVGTPQPNQQALDIVTGKPVFGIDAEIEGMVYAVMQRSPQFDGSIGSVDDRAARAVDGVIDIVRVEGPVPGEPYTVLASGVAVVATSQWSALKGCKALNVTWEDGPNKDENSDDFSGQLDTLLQGKGQMVSDDGGLDAAKDSAAQVLSETYEVPYIAHATLEPQNCVVSIEEDSAKVIAPTQNASSPSRAVHQISGVPRRNIEVELPRSGGGFGRRLTNDFTYEGAIIAKAVGKPVKLLWTREDDMTQDFYRPAGKHNLIGTLDEDGRLTGFAHRLASATKWYRRASLTPDNHWEPELYEGDFPKGLIDNYQREYFSAKSGVPRGSWRAPGHAANAFAMQSFFDELAHAAGQDPLQFRLNMLEGKDVIALDEETNFEPERMAGVLRLAAEKAGWNKSNRKGRGRGRGIAAHFTFSSYCAWVVDVEMTPGDAGAFRVTRAVGAIDCGLAVNPAGVRQQMIGGASDALSTALHQKITISNGGVEETNFDTYQMLRMDESIRDIEVHIVDSPRDPTGVGEIPLPPFAPALCNALFEASGKRIRKLPIADQVS